MTADAGSHSGMRTILILAGAFILAGLAVIFLVVPEGDGGDRTPADVSIAAIVDVQPMWFREPVRVEGTVFPIAGDRFVLRGRDEAIVVEPQPGAARVPLRTGQEVTVLGTVNGFSRIQVDELETLLRSGEHPALRAAPTDLEDVYISAERITTA